MVTADPPFEADAGRLESAGDRWLVPSRRPKLRFDNAWRGDSRRLVSLLFESGRDRVADGCELLGRAIPKLASSADSSVSISLAVSK